MASLAQKLPSCLAWHILLLLKKAMAETGLGAI